MPTNAYTRFVGAYIRQHSGHGKRPQQLMKEAAADYRSRHGTVHKKKSKKGKGLFGDLIGSILPF